MQPSEKDHNNLVLGLLSNKSERDTAILDFFHPGPHPPVDHDAPADFDAGPRDTSPLPEDFNNDTAIAAHEHLENTLRKMEIVDDGDENARFLRELFGGNAA